MTVRRDAVINVRLPARLKTALQRAAEDDHSRSLSGMVVRIAEEWLESHGYLRPPPKRGARGTKE